VGDIFRLSKSYYVPIVMMGGGDIFRQSKVFLFTHGVEVGDIFRLTKSCYVPLAVM
jgi:hypothetical protein